MIKSLFESRVISFLVICFGVLIRAISILFFFNIRSDRSFQVEATQHLVNGHGITNAHVLPNDLSYIIYEPLYNWPPGYSLIQAPFYILLKHNYIATGLTIDIIFSIILIFYTRKTLSFFNLQKYLINIFTVFNCLYIYIFYLISSTDSITIAIFIVAIYHALLLLSDGKKWLSNSLVITLLLLACALIKYLFVPIIFIIPCFLLIKGWIDKNSNLKKSGILSLTLLITVIGCLAIYQSSISGTVGYISETHRGFFPQNLLVAFPFIPSALIKTDTISLILKTQEAQTLLNKVFQLIHFVILGCLTAFVFLKIKKVGIKKIKIFDSFIFLALLISISITFLLAFLSIRVERENWGDGVYWTYIEEPRYYGLITILLHLCIFAFYYHYKTTNNKIIKATIVFLLFCLLPETFRGIAFTANRIMKYGKEEYSWQYEDRFQKFSKEIIKKAKENKPVKNIVVTGSTIYYNRRVSIYNEIPLLKEANSINNFYSLNSKCPTLLLVIINKNELPKYNAFIGCIGNKPDGVFDDYHFYTTYVIPH